MYWFILATVLVAPVYSLRASELCISVSFIMSHISCSSSFHADITSFTQLPSGVVAPNAAVTYNCQAVGSDVTWYIDGVRRDATNSDYTISIEPIDSFEHWNITLTTIASRMRNITRIQCYASGRISGQVDRRSVFIIVAGACVTNNIDRYLLA